MEWIIQSLQLAASTEQLDVLKIDLETQVLKDAVEFALKLRRQNGEIYLSIPQSISRALSKRPALAKTLTTVGSKQNMVRLCIGPQMKKHVPQTVVQEAAEDIISEADFMDVPLPRWISARTGPNTNAQHAEDSEID